jgi:hypothetical protein
MVTITTASPASRRTAKTGPETKEDPMTIRAQASAAARLALGAAAALLLAGCATGATLGDAGDASWRVALQMEPGRWQPVTRLGVPGSLFVEYVPAGESAESWTRIVSVQTFADARVPYPGVRWALAQCRATLVDRCPGATWTVLSESQDDATYEWRVAGCPAEPDQHEVGRIMKREGTWARVTYSTKGEMPAAERAEWLRRLSAARFVHEGP